MSRVRYRLHKGIERMIDPYKDVTEKILQRCHRENARYDSV
jgi:hypothetical protein